MALEYNVEGLLKVGFKYTFFHILTMCEEFLLDDYLGNQTAMDSDKYLDIAIEYQLSELQVCSLLAIFKRHRGIRLTNGSGLPDSAQSD